MEIYATSKKIKLKTLGDELKTKCGKVVIKLPNGQSEHVSEILKDIRDAIIHNKASRKKLYSDPVKLLSQPVYYSDDGSDYRVYSYMKQPKVMGFSCHRHGRKFFIDLLESEYVSLFLMYDYITNNNVDEQFCINNNYWYPITCIDKTFSRT